MKEPIIKEFRKSFDTVLAEKSLKNDGTLFFFKESKNEIPVKIDFINEDVSMSAMDEAKGKVLGEEGVLMVIGHFLSSRSIQALPLYLDQEPPIPVILPLETNCALQSHSSFNGKAISINRRTFNPPVYFLCPPDSSQVSVAAGMIKDSLQESDGAKVWVVQDVENIKYSMDLANAFIKQVNANNRSQVLLLSQINILPSVSTIRQLDFDCVFFVGQAKNGQLLLNYLNETYRDCDSDWPLVILSDGCYDSTLLHYKNEKMGPYYILAPYKDMTTFLENSVFRELELIFQKVKEYGGKKEYYDPPHYRKWLNLDRTDYARETIISAMHELHGESKFWSKKNSFRPIPVNVGWPAISPPHQPAYHNAGLTEGVDDDDTTY